MKKQMVVALLVAAAVIFSLGYYLGTKRDVEGLFHDMIVNEADDISALVTPDDRRVRTLAAELQTPENAYLYVRDRIANDPALPAVPAGEVIAAAQASCLGKAILLCSLYRSMGIPASDVRVVAGEVDYAGRTIDHAWIDMEYTGTCLQQDATNLIGIFRFDEFEGTKYTRSFMREETFAFNDESFAIVSRLNLMKGMGHPVVR